MYLNLAISLYVLAASNTGAASPVGPDAIAACGEKAARVCFGTNDGTAQDVDPEDVAYVATSLRSIGPAEFWTMPKTVDCEEWTIPISNAGTVLALAKHINPRINSSILFENLANAVDGGAGASQAAVSASLLGCGKAGGMMEVKANTSNPLYNTAEYKASGAKPDGILLKSVRAPV